MALAPVNSSGELLTSSIAGIQFRAAPPNCPPVLVCLPKGQRYSVRIDAAFDAFTLETIERLRTRKQWRHDKQARQAIGEACRASLKELGLNPENELDAIAKAGIVQIEIPAGCGESAFAFPWEFVISEATAALRRSETLLVVRYLPRYPPPPGNPPAPAIANQPQSVLIVQSAPGEFAKHYTFESEHKLIQASFRDLSISSLTDPTLATLQSEVARILPGVIHFAGLDGIQGADLLCVEGKPGMWLADEEDPSKPKLQPPDMISAAAAAGNTKPTLVSYNFYNSSWPFAAQTVQKGAAAAVGFQDEIDDSLAELFFARFYEEWQNSDWDILAAFSNSWRGLSQVKSKLGGTGIVLWSANSLVATRRSAQRTLPQESLRLPTEFPNLQEAVTVEVVPLQKLNYSLLHNNRPLFEKIRLKRQVAGQLFNVRVRVELNVGAETARYEASFRLDREQPAIDLNDHVRVSLTSALSRSLRESIYTSLFVNVSWEDQSVYQNTFRVGLLSPDDWRDDDLNRIWLPSFVMPRDPVIAQIVNRAQQALTPLADDSGAGFDGYQSVLPEGPIEQRAECVDQQVRALWWSLIQDYNLAYINPPPSFTTSSQRLRTPTETITGRRGTCIDLALLLAALLEYIDLRPVIFLLQGHAFPGYSRTEGSHDLLRELFSDPSAAEGDGASGPPGGTVQRPWVLDNQYYSRIIELVRQGDLVPIESVALTQRSGFWDAVEQGTANLRSKSAFQSLFDVKLARSCDVTPIPLWSNQQ